MKPKEKEFCRLMTVYADPLRAAREAGWKDPEAKWPELLASEEIAGEIRRRCENIRSIYESTAICGLYRLAYGGAGDALTLLYRSDLTEKELRSLDLGNVAEIKRTDKGVEIKFCDRIKAIGALTEALGDAERGGSGTGLLDAMLLSAEALRCRNGETADAL